MKAIFFILFLFIEGILPAQTDSTLTKNTIYAGGGRQGLIYLKYERLLFINPAMQTVVHLGYGGVPGDSEYGIRRLNKIMPGISQLFGYKFIYLEAGAELSMNFKGKFSYIELNGILGIRYQNRMAKQPSFFLQAGYNPRLYRSHVNDVIVNFFFGLGVDF